LKFIAIEDWFINISFIKQIYRHAKQEATSGVFFHFNISDVFAFVLIGGRLVSPNTENNASLVLIAKVPLVE
jgi:hypothetical protein